MQKHKGRMLAARVTGDLEVVDPGSAKQEMPHSASGCACPGRRLCIQLYAVWHLTTIQPAGR